MQFTICETELLRDANMQMESIQSGNEENSKDVIMYGNRRTLKLVQTPVSTSKFPAYVMLFRSGYWCKAKCKILGNAIDIRLTAELSR